MRKKTQILIENKKIKMRKIYRKITAVKQRQYYTNKQSCFRRKKKAALNVLHTFKVLWPFGGRQERVGGSPGFSAKKL